MEMPKLPKPSQSQAGSVPVPVAPPPTTDSPAEVEQMLLNSIIIYGPTGSRMTSQVGQFAKYIYEKTGGVTRLICTDGGGWGPIQDYVEAGIIVPWRLAEEENPKVALMHASRGGWPEKLRDGLRAPGTKLNQPTREQRAAAMAKVGAYVVEGLTSASQLVIGDTVQKGQKISQDVVGKFTEESDFGSETFGAPSPSHYGFAQRTVLDMIRNFSALPVSKVLYTALEGKGEDRITKAFQYGPQVAGSALTASVPQYVGDCLHFEDYEEEAGTDPTNPKQKLKKYGIRVWFQSHPDILNNATWPAKTRVIAEQAEKFQKTFGPSGYFDLKEKSLYDYFMAQDKFLHAGTESVLSWKAEIDAKRNNK